MIRSPSLLCICSLFLLYLAEVAESRLHPVMSRQSDSDPTSPQVLPAPNVTATGDWADSINRARSFVSTLTLEEKVNLTTGIDIFGRCLGNTGTIPRIGFAGLCLQDSPVGVRATDLNSVFPAGINAAMTWDVDLIQQRGAALGAEHRGKGVNVVLGPDMNLARVPAAGRNWEGFGADPFLTGVASARTIQGIQSQGVIACAKHMLGNEQEHFRGGSGGSEQAQTYSSDIDDRTIHELYAWPFAESVRAGVGSLMCAYNRINSTFGCENSKLINGLAKEEWDFKGFMLSDWAGINGGLQSAVGGMDMNMPGFVGYGIGDQNQTDPANATNSFWGKALVEFVQNGTLPEWRVDDMVTRTMAAFYKMGQDQGYPALNFDYKGVDLPDNEHVDVQGDHATIIRTIGGASTVLLKYDTTKKTIPIKKANIPSKVAIIGSDAGPAPDGPNGCPDKGCDSGTLAVGWGSGQANFPYLIDPLTALQNYFQKNSPNTEVEFTLDDNNLPLIESIAADADLCFVFANADSGEDYITVDGNQGDRNNLTLWHFGDAVINATANNCENTVVVLHTVGVVIMEEWIEHPNITAVLYAGLPGQESGNAIVDVLTGKVNPSARLTFTIAKSADDYSASVFYGPTSETIIHIPYTEKLEIDYRYFDKQDITPRFEFGFGLSYTNFSFSGLKVKKTSSFGKRDLPFVFRDAAAPEPAPRASSSEGKSSAAATATSKSRMSTVRSSASAASSSAISSSGAASSASHVSNSISLSASRSASASVSGSSSGSSISFSFGPTVTPTGGLGGNPLLYDDALSVSFKVKNTGGVDGAEVAQVYLGFPASAGEPPKVLRGFSKASIESGSSASFSITLRNKDLSVWDVVQQKWVIPAGDFQIFVGASSRDIRLTETFTNPNSITLAAS